MISEYVAKIETAFQIKSDELDARSKELDVREASIVSLDKESKGIDKDVKSREKLVKAREKECEAIEKKLEDETVLKQLALQTAKDRDDAISFNKKANEKMSDVQASLLELTKRELALDKERQEYQDRLKKEFLEKFFNQVAKIKE